MTFPKPGYYEEKFTKITLSGEKISGKEFEECTFTDCSFMECTFQKCKFISCTFQDCMFSVVTPTDSRFIEVRFRDSKVIGFDWTQAAHIHDISFERCRINYSSFRLLKLPKLKITDCEAKETDFTESDISEGVFTGTDFERSIFSKTILAKADFTGAKNYTIDVRHNTVKKAKFSIPEALSLLYSLDVVID